MTQIFFLTCLLVNNTNAIIKLCGSLEYSTTNCESSGIRNQNFNLNSKVVD